MARQTILPPRSRLQDAFDVHAALLTAEVTLPYLRDNPQWNIIRMDAYETFHDLMAEAAGAN